MQKYFTNLLPFIKWRRLSSTKKNIQTPNRLIFKEARQLFYPIHALTLYFSHHIEGILQSMCRKLPKLVQSSGVTAPYPALQNHLLQSHLLLPLIPLCPVIKEAQQFTLRWIAKLLRDLWVSRTFGNDFWRCRTYNVVGACMHCPGVFPSSNKLSS